MKILHLSSNDGTGRLLYTSQRVGRNVAAKLADTAPTLETEQLASGFLYVAGAPADWPEWLRKRTACAL